MQYEATVDKLCVIVTDENGRKTSEVVATLATRLSQAQKMQTQTIANQTRQNERDQAKIDYLNACIEASLPATTTS